MKSNLIDLDVQFRHQTEKAVCVRETEDGPDIWIPKSRCQIDPTDPKPGQIVELTTDEYTAVDKGLA